MGELGVTTRQVEIEPIGQLRDAIRIDGLSPSHLVPTPLPIDIASVRWFTRVSDGSKFVTCSRPVPKHLLVTLSFGNVRPPLRWRGR